ncbi:MAG: hypothetical protein JST89_00480 [Cyanobacteria bacterium SZAS-4]|nr:hypothetical protein [Cyanobacteria bacterium SZAS-4]
MTHGNSAIDVTSPPKFMECWKGNLQIVGRSIQLHPLLVCLLLASAVIHTLVPLLGALASIAATISLTFIEFTIIRAVWSNIHDGIPNYVVTDTSAQWMMTVTTLLVNLLTILLALLLILPGGWYLVKSCLSLMAVCLENKTPVDAIKRSHELTKGYFGKAFVICLGAPFLITLAIGLLMLIAVVIVMLPANLISDKLGAVVKIPLQIVLTLMLYSLGLTMKPPLVHLYAFLTQAGSQTTATDYSNVGQSR